MNDIERYVWNGEDFVFFELDEEEKQSIFTFLRDKVGIRCI